MFQEIDRSAFLDIEGGTRGKRGGRVRLSVVVGEEVAVNESDPSG